MILLMDATSSMRKFIEKAKQKIEKLFEMVREILKEKGLDPR